MEINKQIAELITEGRAFVSATLVETKGSAPRDIGAKMVIFPDGSILGTIGGGNFEKMVIDDGLALSKSDSSHLLKKYRFEEKGTDSTGMFCGGEALVFLELFSKAQTLYIFGGGHVGRDLAKIALGLNFRIVVIDDRADVLNQYQKPVKTILTDANFNSDFPKVDKDSYVVIVTHGHKCDKEVLAKVITKDCAYIGMIGSKTKIAKTFEQLGEEGISKAKLAKVHSPIGLDIGAEGPCEIAVAIAAEIIAVKRKTGL